MSKDEQDDYITALTDLHRDLEYKGPGDPSLSRKILSSLTSLPPKPRIADLGCGSGASACLLANYFQSTVMAVDLSLAFIEELKAHIKYKGLEHLVMPILGDMATLDWPDASIDLLWSEGAAYNLGFEQALKLWRRLLSKRGMAVISEMSWFSDNPPEAAIAFWQAAYPQMGSEQENIARANQAGFRLLSMHRLPSHAWWSNYYEPLRERIQKIAISPNLQPVIRETEAEIRLFEKFSDFYGYTFYILQLDEEKKDEL